jgi:hypothetical protein
MARLDLVPEDAAADRRSDTGESFIEEQTGDKQLFGKLVVARIFAAASRY